MKVRNRFLGMLFLMLLVMEVLMRPLCVSAGTVWLMIDNQNCYENMEKSYSEGYIPKVIDETVYLVVPIVSTEELKGKAIRVSLDLGEVNTMPFVCKNYVKNVSLNQVKVNGGKETKECYLVSFALELKENRQNGSYPVVLTVKGSDESGNAVEQKFIVYVTITDGKSSDEKQQSGEDENITGADSSRATVDFTPKIIIQSCQFSKEHIYSGNEFQADITLKNTSATGGVRNLTVTIGAPTEQFRLMSPSDTVYVDSIPAGETVVVSYQYQVNVAALQGQYDLEIALDYADAKGTSCAGSGKVQIPVEQQMKVQFDPLVLSSEVQVGDVVEAQVQTMNLGRGKAYNVRAVLEADGLAPEGTIFIGDVEAGTTTSASIQVSVTSLSEGNSMYGKTKGTVTFYYEDEAGKEYQETAAFSTTITSPFSDSEKAEDETGQWWIIMIVIGVILGIFLVIAVLRGIQRRKLCDEMVE